MRLYEDQTKRVPHIHCPNLTSTLQGAVQTPSAEGERADCHDRVCETRTHGALYTVRGVY